MLHCASNAAVVRPLAFEAGVLPDSGTGVGVAQIQGVVCEPSSTGPPLGWVVITHHPIGGPVLLGSQPTPRIRATPKPLAASGNTPASNASGRPATAFVAQRHIATEYKRL